MSTRLQVLGVAPAAEALYRAVLREPGLAAETYADRLSMTSEARDDAVEQLRLLRLVRSGESGLQADHPRAALERVLSAEEARLATRRQDLARVRDAIDQFAADHRVGQERSAEQAPARERVDSAALESVHEHLAASTDGPILISHQRPGPAPEALPVVRRMLDEGRVQRAIYLSDVVPTDVVSVRAWADAGEQQRVSVSLPSQFVCFGNSVALASTEWGRDGGDHVVLRDPMVVSAFVELFERLWAAAAPIEATDGADEQLIELMQQGLKDEAIARLLGISLRTVRRRVAALMQDHSVGTRFQLAMRLAERGRALERSRVPSTPPTDG